MADADVQSMLIRIEATTAQLRQEIARGDAAVAQSAGKIDSSLGKIDSGFDRTGANASALQKAVSAAFTGIGLASAAAVAGLVAITVKTTSYAQEVKNLSYLSNSSVTDFQRLAAGAKTVGIEQDKLGDILKDTTDRVGEFIQRGGGEMADFFKEIAPKVGVTAQMFAKLSGPDALQLYYNSLEKAGLNQAQMTTYMESMADEATALIPLLKNNGEGFKTFGDRAEKAGQILKSFEIDQLVEVNQSIKALEGSFEGASRQLVLGMLPGIQSVTDRLTSMSSNGAMEALGAGVGFLADHLNILAAVMGAKVTASFVGYVQSLGASAIASSQARSANIAQAASAVETATANQIAAQSAVVRAEREAIAARGTAVQTQMSIQLAEARMAERTATAQLAAAQAGLKGASAGLLGLFGGPAGLAALAIGAGIAFLTMRDNTSLLEKKLGDLADPLEKLTERFDKLNRATQAVTLRELQSSIADTQSKISQMSGAMADKFENDLRNMGAAGADGLMAGLVSLPADTQAALDKVRQASKDQAAGVAVDWKAVADELRKVPGVTEQMAQSLESSQSPVSDLSAVLMKQQQTLAALTAETDKNTASQNQNSAAKGIASAAGEKYIGELTKQLQTAQDKTFVEQANRFISENKELTEGQIVAIRSLAAARDSQKASDDAATKATKDSSGATKKAATEEEGRAKALADLKAQTEIAIRSATGLGAAYLDGTDKSREFTLQQKVEEALLKTGAGVRKDVEKAISDQQDAQDRLNVSKSAYDLGKETADIIAQAQATLMGADALAAYNVQKAMTVALANKNIEVGSEEYKQLLAATEAQQDALKIAQRAANAGGIMDRLYPEAKLLKDYTEDQKALNAAMALYPGNAANYQAALLKLGNEYEVNRSKATIWGQMTEGAIDRIDEAFATAWGNIGSGAESLWDNLKKGFKQTLGEIAHMLTTKPLLASISNWLTGTDNGQGLSSVWSKLLGGASGSSSSSGGGLFGSGNTLVSMGKSIYQAYSAITGVGSSIASGYASGGVGGAISGGVGYYGNLLSSLGTTLSGGLSSIVGAITGSTATQVAANAATSAALQGAVAQGAAQVGTSIGIGGAAQLGAGAAAGAGTAAAAGAGAGFYASLAAMASNPVGWVIAAVTSAYQSGKLYDQGVRWNTKDVMNTDLVKYSGGIGQATLAPLALTNNVLEKVVGGKMAAIFSGSTFASAIITKVSEKIFGGSWATKDGGLSLGIEGGDFLGRQYIDQKKKGGLFGKDKKRTRYSALDPQMQEALQANYYDTQYSVLDLFTRLNVSLNDGVMDGLNVAATKISTKGKTGEEIQEAITKWFGGVADSMVSAVDLATKSGLGGYNFEALTTFVNNLYSVNAAVEKFGVKAVGFNVAGGKAVETLVAVSGGMEALTTGMNDYYAAFTTEMDRSADSLAAARAEFTKFGFTLPGTRDGLKDVVKGLDLTTEIGQNMFSAIVRNAKAAADAYTILEQRESAYRKAFFSEAENTALAIKGTTAELKALGVTLPASRSEYRKMVEEAAKSTTDTGKAMYDTLMNAAAAASTVFDELERRLNQGVTDSFSGVQRSISAQQKAATAAYNATNTSLSDMSATAVKSVTDLSSVSNSLESALKSLRGTSDDAVKTLRAQAQATLQSALATARTGGSLAGFTGLEDALSTVSDNNTDLYGSMEDFARDQGRTANVVAELNAINGKQLTAAEKLQKSLEDQIKLAQDDYKLAMDRFDNELANAQAQMDAFNGIDTSVKSVEAAIKALNGSLIASLAAKPATGAGSAVANTAANNATVVDTLYQQLFGRTADAGENKYWADRLGSGNLPYAEIVANMTQYASAADKAAMAAMGKVPAYASGGDHLGGLRLVGENGPELEVTGPSRIYNANQTASMMRSGGDSGATAAEMRALRKDVESNATYMAKLSKRMADGIDTLVNSGMQIIGTVDTKAVA